MNNKTGWVCIIKSIFVILWALIAVSAAIVNYGFRIGYVFIDHEVFQGFSDILFYVMVVNAVYSIGIATATLAKKHIPVIITIISWISFILSLIFWGLNYIISIQAFAETAYIIICDALPYIAALFGIPFLLLCFPNLNISTKIRNIIAVVLSVIFVGMMGVAAITKIPLVTFKFEVQPVVFDIGTDKYSVVFATNADAQAYVTYICDGQLKTVYANEAGYKAVGRIHSVKIPRSELDGNQYTAHATRVIERLAYGGKLGKTISTKTYTLKNTTNIAEPKILVASDWHNRLELLDSAANYFKHNADLVIFNGDYADFYVNEYQIVKYFLGGAFILTGGEVPGIFVRGNHEVRGNEKVEDLGRKIGLTNMYYQVRRGNNLFTIFDTGECEAGDKWEHDGFYDMIPYFTEQIEWFENLPVPDISVNNIVLMHDTDFTSTHDDLHAGLAKRFKNKANAFNIDFSVSGHTHAWHIHKPDINNFNFHRIEDGGRNGGHVIKTLGDTGIFRNIKNPVIRMILYNTVLESSVERYRLSLITVGNIQITFDGVDNSGNYSSDIFVR